ncbi:hypothetical protein QO002_002136 [Pararhizobium capsulatum DSM 1112]|uniref:NinB protein n=1 Tax=Pararhizobium capsulatum DSM 1112 TaxID=1121113 RepID=A0ABU0BP34_9HYPH|nr:recombination protein NinB [Pararhizobium capsulatum]MDQ0319998.1 hypothetical protein [Pararhizobium capsulatum DSM 1112]
MNTRATVTIKTNDDRAQVARWAQNVDPGTVVTFRKKSRSSEQSAKMWAMLNEVSDQVEWYGQKLDAEDWKDVFTASLRHARVVPGIDKGTFVPLGMHTSTLTIDEMSNLIELIYAFGAERSVVFKESLHNAEPADDTAPPSSVASADASIAPAEGDGSAPLPSPSTLSASDLTWLAVVARMLWAATPKTNDTEEALRVLNVQRLAIDKPEGLSEFARDKAGSIYIRCKECLLGTHSRGDTLRYIANMAGVDVSELEG